MDPFCMMCAILSRGGPCRFEAGLSVARPVQGWHCPFLNTLFKRVVTESRTWPTNETWVSVVISTDPGRDLTSNIKKADVSLV